MSARVGIVVFARYDSTRLPGKALRPVGGMPLLERVIRRAKLCSLPVFLATTDLPSDDALVALAETLGVQSFRGSSDRVLERAVLAAETFGLDVFVRLCGDRPLFPLDDLRGVVSLLQKDSGADDGSPPDLITTYVPDVTPRGLTTELIRTSTLRTILERKPTADDQEHVTPRFYDHPEGFRIVRLSATTIGYACPGFAVDTEADLHRLESIFAVSAALDLSPSEADRIYRG